MTNNRATADPSHIAIYVGTCLKGFQDILIGIPAADETIKEKVRLSSIDDEFGRFRL